MKKRLRFLSLALFAALPLHAQQWSFGAGAGAFVFGDFVKRTSLIGNETSSTTITTRLSAATRPGLSLDLERDFGGHFGIRLEGSFTDAKLSVRTGGSSTGVNLDAGKIDVTTVMLPLVFNSSKHGALRFHIMGGPAYAMYHVKRRTGAPSNIGLFEGTRNRMGWAAGGGISWWLGDQWAIEGNLTDVVTKSPIERSDLPPTASGFELPKTQNVHTTLGLRYRF